jgi:Helix-turn-helix domain
VTSRTLVSVAEAAKILRVSEASVYAYARRGVLIGGRRFWLTRYGSRYRRMFDLGEVEIIRKGLDEPND